MKPILTPKMVLREGLTRRLDRALGTPKAEILVKPDALRPSMGQIIAVTAELMDFRPIEIMRQNRSEGVVLARHLAMYVAVRSFGYGMSEMGRHLRRDHTTVMHGVARIEGMIEAGIDPIHMITKVIGVRAGYRPRAEREIAARREMPPIKPWFDLVELDAPSQPAGSPAGGQVATIKKGAA